MKTSRKHAARSSPGFTLIEMMVALAVLGLIVALLANVLNLAVMTTISSRKHMDADTQARLVFDRMADDFSRIVRRTDADSIFFKNTSGATGVNDAMFFYTESHAYANVAASPSTLSLVGYRIDSNPSVNNPNNSRSTTPQLERLAENLTWDTVTSNDATTTTSNTAPGTPVFLAWTASNGSPATTSLLDGIWSKSIGTAAGNYADGKDSDYFTLGDLTYRMEIMFLLSDGTLSTKPVTNPGTTTNFLTASAPPTASSDSANTDGHGPFAIGSRWYDTTGRRGYICTSATATAAQWSTIGIQDISAVVVGLAMLDGNSLKIVTNSSQMIGALPDAVDGTPVAQTWAGSTYLTTSGLPNAAADQIRLYQRYFFINNQ